MTTTLSDSYDDLEDTLIHMKKDQNQDSYEGNCCILMCCNIDRCWSIDSSGDFNTENLIHITHIFGYTYNSRFSVWSIQNYKAVTEFTNNFFLCDEDIIHSEELIIYKYLVQEATHKYHNLLT